MAQADQTLEFGPFQLSVARGELRFGAERIHLRPKTWQVLCCLAERPGVLVTRRELLDAVWGETAVVPHVLTNTVNELRRALEAGADGAQYVETIPRRGFRLVTDPVRPGDGSHRMAGGSALIGRDDEFDLLANRWKQAREGARQLAFVSGPPGIGKTSLVETFATGIDGSSSALVLWAGCIEHQNRAEPFFSLLSAFGDGLRSSEAAALRAALERYGRRWLVQIPGAVPREELKGMRAELAASTPGQLLREGVEVLEAFAEIHPLLLVLEDLQWGDESTLELLSLLASRRNPARILVVCTFRPGEALAYDSGVVRLARNLRRAGVAELSLAPFSESHVRDYLAARFDAPAADALVRVAAEQTAGVPLHLRLAADHYETNGWVERADSGWRLTNSEAVAVEDLPEDLTDLIAAEYHALGEDEAAVLRAASLYGDAFAPSLLAPVVGMTAQEIDTLCGSLARSGRLVDAEPDEAGERSYRFRHDVHRRIVEDLARDEARELHAKIASALETLAPSDPSLIAYHFREARDPEHAAGYFERAAISAILRSAFHEAIVSIRAAVEQVAELPTTTGRREQLSRLQSLEGGALMLVEGYGSRRALECFDRGSEIAESIGNHAVHFQAETGRFLSLLNSAKITSAVAAAAKTREIAEKHLPDLQAVADALYGFGLATAADPNCVPILERALRSNQALVGGSTIDLSNISLAVIGFQRTFRGELREAREVLERAVVQADAGRPLERALVNFFACVGSAAERDMDVTLTRAQRCLELAEEFGIRSIRHGGTVMSEWVHAFRDPTRDTGTMRQALNDMRSAEEHWAETAAIALLALLEVERGDLGAAQSDIDTGLRWSRASGEGFGIVDLWCAQGELHRRKGELESAQEAGAQAVEAALQQQAPLLALRARVALARTLSERGQIEDARETIQKGLGDLPEKTTCHDLTAANAFLARLP